METMEKPTALIEGLKVSEEWWEIEIVWKTGEPNEVVKFGPPKQTYEIAYDNYLLCVATAIGHKETTPAKRISFSRVWLEGEDEIFDVVEITEI